MRNFWIINAILLAGCASVRDAILQDCLLVRTSIEAGKAWEQFCDIRANGSDDWASEHYERGFKDGYVGVGMGATGCPPTLPPSKYWKLKYRTMNGKVDVTDWYNGYAEGAHAAKLMGIADRNRVHTAIDVYHAERPPHSSPGLSVESPLPSPEIPVVDPVLEAPLDAPLAPPDGQQTFRPEFGLSVVR
jgi:hypothetical protein